MRGLKESGIVTKATAQSVGSELLLEVWKRHCYSEFVMKDAKGALATMSDNPYVLMVPIATPGSLSRSARSASLSLKTERSTEHLYWDQASVLEPLWSYVHRLAETGARNRQEARWHEC
jgi:hypothetical protein